MTQIESQWLTDLHVSSSLQIKSTAVRFKQNTYLHVGHDLNKTGNYTGNNVIIKIELKIIIYLTL